MTLVLKRPEPSFARLLALAASGSNYWKAELKRRQTESLKWLVAQ